MAFTSNNIKKTKEEKQEFVSNLNEQSNQATEYHLNMKLNNFLFKDENSNFFVVSATLADGEPNLDIEINERSLQGRKLVVVGTSQIMQSIVNKQEFEVWGHFEPGKQPGSIQLTATSIQECIPKKPEAIKLFLGSGKITGIGEGLAKRIVDKFGATTLDVLDNSPEDLLTVTGINSKKLEGIKKSWAEWRAVYEIVATMRMYEVGDVAGMKVFNHFKEKSIDVIRNDPYALTEVESIGFKTADKIAQSIGIEKTDPKRIEKCILFTLEELAEKGHTAYPIDELEQKVQENLRIEFSYVKDKLKELMIKETIVCKQVKIKVKESKFSKNFYFKETSVLAHKKFHTMEVRIAKELHRLVNSPELFDKKTLNSECEAFVEANPFDLDNSQISAVRKIISNKVCVLTGGPGTGKTHTLKSLLSFFTNAGKIVKMIADLEKGESIKKTASETALKSILSAPTGRAAKRMNESTGLPSSTIHRLLGFKDGKFTYNELTKLEGDVFVIDESSMVDIFLGAALLKAIPSHAKLIIVGDFDQLSSVAAGEFLKDIINSDAIPVARLKDIHRQAANSKIIVAAHDIINEKMPQLYDYDSSSDFVFIESERKNNKDTLNKLLGVVKDLLANDVHPNDIQVLTPKKESELGVYEINSILRLILNDQVENYEESKMKFIPNDRVMQLKNNKDEDIYNGDVGLVESINEEEGFIKVKFDDKKVEMQGKEISELILSYACTIHKSQGSDYPYVIIPISHSHSFMWDINLLYTAVTRGKKRVILIGDLKTLQLSVSTFKQTERVTTLREEIMEVFNVIEDKERLLPNQIKEPNLFASMYNNEDVYSSKTEGAAFGSTNVNPEIKVSNTSNGFKRRKVNVN
jgi:exodeoxyribonuclease V alpha subunit